MSDLEQGRLAQAISDWLVATDDAMCGRPTTCTLCGSSRPTYFDIAVLANGCGVAYRLCDQCHRQDPNLERMATLLTQRYSSCNQSPGG